MGFTGAMQQFLRACCGKKNKGGKDTDDVDVAPPPESVAPAELPPSTALSKSKWVREAASKRQPTNNEESTTTAVVSVKKVSKSPRSRRVSSGSTTNSSSQYSTRPKGKSKSRRVSSSSKNNKTRDDDDTIQPEESTTTARSRRKGKLQRVTSRDKPTSAPSTQQSPMAMRKWMVDSAVFRSQLKRFAADTVRIGVQGLVEQFAQLKAATTALPAKTHFDANRERNRYKDVVCVDRTRVILRWPAGAANDYIHANWVEFKGERKFICTQAPVESTIDDFWRLVWQEKCKSIVMLCELIEQNKQKCEAYWPTMPQQSIETASELRIRNVQVTAVEASLTVSLLEVSCKSEAGAEPLEVRHFKWNNWPDRGVPENRMAPLRLLDQLNDDPILIHCSAGIGRTGTIVGLHMALQVLNAGEELQLARVVHELRAQRHGSVQTITQFLFMHRTLLQLAENMSLVTEEEIEPFSRDYEKFVKDRG